MLNRRGVIAAIVAACANPLARAQSSSKSAGLTVILDSSLTDYFAERKNCKLVGPKFADQDAALLMCDAPPVVTFDYALEVRFNGRVVRLTGDEIMDALEGKP